MSDFDRDNFFNDERSENLHHDRVKQHFFTEFVLKEDHDILGVHVVKREEQTDW